MVGVRAEQHGGEYRFDLDLSKGHIAEDQLRDILCGDAEHVTIEVKRDYKVSDTGNVAIEYRCRGQRSGIAKSTADWWAVALSGPGYDGEDGRPEVFVLVKRRRLSRVLKRLSEQGRLRPATGGDDGTSVMALLRVSDLLQTFIELD